ncbi:MAG TPA: FAD-binding oxidoreductase [Mycobacteriales bacterium]|nr:FAD-binding oxidoreductase [Mycobacteriales bacterium]
MAESTYPVWGWGRQRSDEPSATDLAALAPLAEGMLGHKIETPLTAAPLPPLPGDRVTGRLTDNLAQIASSDPHDRARHSLGRSYRDVVRAIAGRYDHVVDCVLRPRSETQITAALEWCADNTVAVVPFGGGTSVVGGVEPDVGDDWSGCVSLDLSALSGLVEVDQASRAVRVRAGTAGPDFEDALRPHGLTARFYPQSFERSTVGGWIVTRAAGHFSMGPTHIDDLIENVRAVTPSGVWESRRLPGSGAGPSPDRALLGSEGTLGVVTEAWLRVQPRPAHRWSATYGAPDLATGLDAVRAIAQTGIQPATLRLIDSGEAMVTGTLATGEAALVLGLEAWSGPVDGDAEVLTTLCNDYRLRFVEGGAKRADDGAGASWRSSFLRAPYLREQLVMLGLVVETFETATTWDRIPALIADVTQRTTEALREVCGGGTVTCRLTHVYPDGAAPYFTVIAPGRPGAELEQWQEVKAAASEALLAAGGTITHHHAVGRDHRPWYDKQRPDLFAAALQAAKSALDPAGILNPGVLLGP